MFFSFYWWIMALIDFQTILLFGPGSGRRLMQNGFVVLFSIATQIVFNNLKIVRLLSELYSMRYPLKLLELEINLFLRIISLNRNLPYSWNLLFTIFLLLVVVYADDFLHLLGWVYNVVTPVLPHCPFRFRSSIQFIGTICSFQIELINKWFTTITLFFFHYIKVVDVSKHYLFYVAVC